MNTVSPVSGNPNAVLGQQRFADRLQIFDRQDRDISLDGRHLSINEAINTVLFKSVGVIDQTVGSLINNMQSSNSETSQCQDFLSMMRGIRPSSSKDHIAWDDFNDICNQFKEKYGYLPQSRFGFTDQLHDSDRYSRDEFDKIMETIKGHLSGLNSDQQLRQVNLEKYNNMRNQNFETVSALSKTLDQLFKTQIQDAV